MNAMRLPILLAALVCGFPAMADEPAVDMPPPRETFDPQASRFGALLGMNVLGLGAPGAGLVGETTGMVRFETGVRWAPGNKPFGLEATYLRGSTSADSFGLLGSELGVQSVQLMGTWHLPAWQVVRGYGRGGALMDLATLRLGNAAEGTVLTDSALSFGLEGTLGAELLLASPHGRHSQHFAVFCEVGYAWRFAPARFSSATPTGPSSTDPEGVGFVPVDLGNLSLSGVVWRLGLAFRL